MIINTKSSSMRFCLVMTVVTACFVAIGAVAGYILAVWLDRDMAMVASILGGFAGIIGALLVPAFTGKAIQRKFENEKEDQ